jgi:hypothetical protein
MRVEKRDEKLEFCGVFFNRLHNSYTYNRLYNDNWRSFALQLRLCPELDINAGKGRNN